MIRIGIVGTGLIAHHNIPALLKTGRAEIVALCNRTREKAEGLAVRYGLEVPVFTDYREMIRQIPMHAVLLNTPHGQHCEQFIACAEQGLSVLVEKPLATSVEDGRRMVAARDGNGVRGAVCHTQRYLAPMMTLRDFLRGEGGEAMGPIRHIVDTLNLQYFRPERPAWFFDADSAGGGLLMTHGAHQIDRVHYLLGSATDTVHAHMEYGETYPGIDTGYQILGIAGDKSYVVSCGGYPGVHTSTLQLTCERGTIRVSLFDTGIEGEGVYVGDAERPFEMLPCWHDPDDAYTRQFDDMLDAIEGRPNGAPTLEEALAVLVVLEKARQSLE